MSPNGSTCLFWLTLCFYDVPQSVESLWASERPLPDNTQHSQQTNRQTSMPWVGFKPTISAGERQKTYALDRAATGIGNTSTRSTEFSSKTIREHNSVLWKWLRSSNHNAITTYRIHLLSDSIFPSFKAGRNVLQPSPIQFSCLKPHRKHFIRDVLECVGFN